MAAFFLKNYVRLGVENRLKAKKIYTMVAFVMLIALYIVIFRFSAEDGEQSSDVSTRVTEALLKGYYGLLGKSGEVTTELVLLLEGVVRKLAHFLEYMAMGFLSYSIVVTWRNISKKGTLAVTLQVFISAALDECHQYFIPGRCAALKDVFIDTAGGITGILVIILFTKFFCKKRISQMESPNFSQ